MQGNDSFRLVVRRGPQPNQTYDLTKDITTVGRDITNDIVINDPEVSRHHLRFSRTADGFTIEDLGSTNGTFINGQRLSGSRPLNNGDMISLGETVTLGYERLHPAGSSPATAPSPSADPMPQPAQPASPGYGGTQQPGAGYPPPAQQQDYMPTQDYYAQPEQTYGQPEYGAPAASYGTPSYGAPPAYGYDDPYAYREEEPRSTMRWIAIGCLGLGVFCCCATGIGLVIIDALNLWYSVPIIRDIAPLLERIAGALGLAGG
jgi:pSer/pThr/pTyr-binding forkhead associated (FHA) protein